MKDEMLQEILNDNSVSKVEKLDIISENKLLPYATWIQEVFKKYYDEFNKIIKANPVYIEKYGKFSNYDTFIDDMFHSDDNYERHEIIDLSQVAREAEEVEK